MKRNKLKMKEKDIREGKQHMASWEGDLKGKKGIKEMFPLINSFNSHLVPTLTAFKNSA